MKTVQTLFLLGISCFLCMGADDGCESSDRKAQKSQEIIMNQANDQIGMPAIKNFREKKILKDILEMRDRSDVVTYTYVFSEVTGKFTYLGQTIGFGIPYSTQYTNPQKIETGYTAVIAQADPNALFSPPSAEGTWIMMWNPIKGKNEPQYIESRITVLTMKLPANLVQAGY